jgi:hypothetical protein
MVDALLDIPLWLPGSIMRDWLAPKVVGFLDKAYCTKSMRSRLFDANHVGRIIPRAQWSSPWHAMTAVQATCQWTLTVSDFGSCRVGRHCVHGSL